MYSQSENTNYYIKFPYTDKKNKPLKIWENLNEILEVNNISVMYNEIAKDIEIKGVEEYNVENYIYRVEIVCFPYSYFSVRRKFNELLKYEFEKNNIPVSPENIEIKIKEK